MTDNKDDKILTEEEKEETADKASEENEAKAEATEEPEKKAETEDKEVQQEEDADTRYLRLMADFQNYKRRVEKEKSDLYAYANEKIVVELLEVLDNFERALGQDAGDGFKEGMEMIFKQMNNVLEKAGLTEIEALGEEFDPNVHSAVMTEENEKYESGKVSGVMMKGYKLNGKVIRPSMVKVVS